MQKPDTKKPLASENASLKEKDIGLKITEWLKKEDWDCFPEAQLYQRGPRADMVAIKGPLLWVIETKLTLNLHVISQALRWKKIGALYTSIAVLKPKRSRSQRFTWYSDFVDNALRQEGLGLILMDPDNFLLYEAIPPKLFRYNYNKSKMIKNGLDVRMKNYIPGSTSAEGYSSPGHRTLENALYFLREKQECSINELLQNIKTHFRIRAKSRKFLIDRLCKHPQVDYTLKGYNVIFHYKGG